ncbi:MAG: serine hydrolase, partial [Caulobacter sp.]
VFQRQDGVVERFFAQSGAAAYERIGRLFNPALLAAVAALTALASIATLGGALIRSRRDTRQTTSQARASLLQSIQAVLWLAAMACTAVFAAGSGDVAAVVFGWPSGWLLTASACAFVASLLNLGAVPMVPLVWRGGRRVDSWGELRKLAFTITVLIFVAFAALLVLWNFVMFWDT